MAQAVSGRDSPSFEHWQQAVNRICGRFETLPTADPTGFVGDIALHDHGPLAFAEVRTNAPRVYRERRHVAADDGRYYFLLVQCSGQALIRQEQQQTLLRQGDMVLVDSCRPSDFCYQSLSHQLSFHLPRPLVERQLRGRAFRPCSGIGADSAAGRLLALLVRQLYQAHQSLDEAQAEAAQEALVALLAPLVGGLPQPAAAQPAPALLLRAQTLIEERLTEPELCPAAVAHALGISPRQLYRLFEAQGTSVARHIQERRLARIAADLASPAHRQESITAIAFYWGFNDSAHFSRAFKSRYGVSPREWRARMVEH
ncbi:MAG TPA: transcriptional regulator FeaR [Candidatus Competibacteraceae bacterium]|nr:transcriptional regulator FeaR [Candidatus Competibacteraceae bacterium]